MQKQVTIIGAGLVGSLLSIYLAKRGYQVSIYERRGDMRKQEVEPGRSVNLALSERGIRALAEVEIGEEVLKIAVPMYGRQIHNVDGTEAFQPYGKQGEHTNSVSRRELNCKLMNLAEKSGVSIFFYHRLQHVNFSTRTITLETNSTIREIKYQLLFGADGAYSAARLAHMLQHQQFEYHQTYIDCGYKELTIPVGHNGTFLLEKNALHIWPRNDYMLIAFPNIDSSFTGTLFFPFVGEPSFESLNTNEKVQSFFQQNFPDVLRIIPNLCDQFSSHPTSSLVTVKCAPWIRKDHFCLIGDAAHAIVPFFGQGMNAGFEDCSVLNGLIDEYEEDWSTILTKFQELRKPDTDAIADLAIDNFAEISERTADSKFLLQKKIEGKLHQKYPDKWIPAYAQVTFNPNIRYSEALRSSRRQEQIMQRIMLEPGIENKWNSDEIEQEILALLQRYSFPDSPK